VKVIIAGSRTLENRAIDIQYILSSLRMDWLSVTEVVSGTARGVDQIGEDWAKDWDIPVKRFPADWDKHGKAAGFIRNGEMADYADACIIIWDGKSNGTKDMMTRAIKQNLKLFVYTLSED